MLGFCASYKNFPQIELKKDANISSMLIDNHLSYQVVLLLAYIIIVCISLVNTETKRNRSCLHNIKYASNYT